MRLLRYSYWIQVVILFVIYFVTARFGLSLGAVSGFATLVWLPTGISLVALFLFGKRLWPGIAAGAFAVNLFAGASPLVAAGIAIGNTLEAVLGVFLLKRFQFHPSLATVRDVFLLTFLVTPFSTFLSATIGVFSLLQGGVISQSGVIGTWIPWWVGDVVSDIILAPLLFVYLTQPFIKKSPRKIFELALLVFFTVLVGLVVFQPLAFDVTGLKTSPIVYLVFPIIIWASLRFGQKETITTIFLLSALAIWGTVTGMGPFSIGLLALRLLLLQSFMIVIAVTSLILSTVVTERREIEKRKEQFISLASHELRTPITSMKLFTEILVKYLQQSNDSQALKYVKKVQNQTDTLKALVNDLLDLTSIQTGKMKFKKETFHMEEVIGEAVDELQNTTRKHTIEFKTKASCEIQGDRYRLYQVLSNLLTNAIKYSPKGGKIVIKMSKNSELISISVQDHGLGIAADQQGKIFQQLYQSEDTGNGVFGGLGIGLYISKEIIKRHGGDIWVKSTKGRGSTFYFSLPIQESN